MNRSVKSVIDDLEQIILQLPNTPQAPFRKRAYREVIDKLQPFEGKLTSVKIKKLSLTTNMTQRIQELADGTITINDIIPKNTSSTNTPTWLLNIDGIGEVKAIDLIAKFKVKSKKDLLKPEVYNTLPEETQVTLKYPPVRRIPREVITQFELDLRKAFGVEFIIVGSYRRGALTSGDIDVMVVGNKDNFVKMYDILTSNFSFHPFVRGESKFAGIIVGLTDKSTIKINGLTQKPINEFQTTKSGANINAHIDVFYSSPEERATQLLYSTGSRLHNIQLRAAAKRKGWLLNQHGLFKKESSDDSSKVRLIRISTHTEADIYKELERDYVSPADRN